MRPCSSTLARLLRSPWALLAAVVLLRLPGFVFGVLNIDEADYAVIGAGLARGQRLYLDLVEMKPPHGFYTYALAGIAGSIDLWPIRVLGVLWVFATALLLGRAAREATSDEATGTAAAWLSLLAGLCEVPAFGGEVMLNLPVALALLCFVRGVARASRAWLLGCGAAVALASLYKLQGGLPLGTLGLGLLVTHLRDEARGPWWQRLLPALGDGLCLLAGFLLPWAAWCTLYTVRGSRADFLDWTFTRSLLYAGSGAAGSALERFLVSTLECVGVAILPWVLACRDCLRGAEAPPLWRRLRPALCLTLFGTWAAVAAGGRFYEHYYLQFVPPLSLLAAPAAARLFGDLGALSRPRRLLLQLAWILPLVGLSLFTWGKGLLGRFPGQDEKARTLAAFLAAESRPDETVVVWGHYTPIYYLSKRLPGTRYVNTSVQMGNFDPAHLPDDFDAGAHRSARDVQALLDDLETRRPALLADTAPADIHDWRKIPLAAFPELRAYVDQHYRLVGRPASAAVYRRVR